MHDVVVYSREGCHLCDIVKETLAQVQGQADFAWQEVDIDGDPELRQSGCRLVKQRQEFAFRIGPCTTWWCIRARDVICATS